MKILIAGLGSIGRRHLWNLVALGEDDIVLYRTHQSTLPEDELAKYPIETDLDAALAESPDAIIVSNPTALHLDVAIPAAQAGCHLFLEKPVADQMDERVRTLQQVVEKNDLRTLVGFQFRFHPVFSRIRDVVQSGELGLPLSIRVHWGEYLPGWHPWEDYRQSYAARKELGGGVVNTLCHTLDYVRWLIGEVESLFAVAGHVSDLEIDVEDLAEIILRFENGCIGSIHLDYFQRPPAHWLEINFERGHLCWENSSGAAKVYKVLGERWETLSPPMGFERNDLFVAEMAHFLALIRGETPSRSDLDNGLRVMQITEAVHQSANAGCMIDL